MSAHTKKYISISLLGHVLALLTIVMTFPLQSREASKLNFITPQIISMTQTSERVADHDIRPNKVQPLKAHAARSPGAHTLQAESLSSSPAPELMRLLHTAIEQAQQYPASAQEQQREGRVTLAFTLAPNGSISHSRVAASSGISSLDHAALQALHAAAPFQHINKYLHSVENYQIDVIFKLN